MPLEKTEPEPPDCVLGTHALDHPIAIRKTWNLCVTLRMYRSGRLLGNIRSLSGMQADSILNRPRSH